MDEQKKQPEIGHDDHWFAELLTTPKVDEEINADEQAASAAGLTHPDDLELEKIIEEAKLLGAEDTQNVAAPQDLSSDFADDTQPVYNEVSEITAEEEPETQLPLLFDTQATEPVPVEEALDQPSETPERHTEQTEVEVAQPQRKRRPQMKKGYGLFGIPHIIATAIWLAIAVAIGVSLGRLIWVCAADVLAFGKENMEVTLTITEEDDIDSIAEKLKNAGLIEYPGLFKLYAELTDAQEDIATGTFTLNSIYDYHALVGFMTPQPPAREVVTIMIPEGYTCAQIFELLAEKGVCTVEELEDYAANGELSDYWFLDGVERGDRYCLEGYLFPDTYDFYTHDRPGRVLGKFLSAFDYRYTDVMKSKLEPLNKALAKKLSDRGYSSEYIEEHRITIREIVIIASMIEKETANGSESYDISSVIYNRLSNPKNYPFLNIDATLIYMLGGNIDPETGKTKPLTDEDKKIESPYNTYASTGLIPGPISNPGRNSLDAALSPNETSYYFYAFDPSNNSHKFSKTYKEHQKFLDSLK